MRPSETHPLRNYVCLGILKDTNDATLFVGSSPNLSSLRHHLRGCRAKIPCSGPRPRLPPPSLPRRSKRKKLRSHSFTLLSHFLQKVFLCSTGIDQKDWFVSSLCLRCLGRGSSWLPIWLTLMMGLCQWIEGFRLRTAKGLSVGFGVRRR